ncbi:hypothetical protein ACFSKL_20455 [Belliella marina]|uniref:Outer membrane protein beta-barrel domain-containing protein n=1 Tax=Belliella marina TaxID=1644146 RepID=A0ABW4VU20_9BACT
MKYIILFFLLFAQVHLVLGQTNKAHYFDVGLRGILHTQPIGNLKTNGFGLLVNHSMTVFNNPNWYLRNEIAFERLFSKEGANRPLLRWYENSVRYKPTIERGFRFLDNNLTFGVGVSFYYGTILSSVIWQNDIPIEVGYRPELYYNPGFTLTYNNPSVSKKMSLRLDYDFRRIANKSWSDWSRWTSLSVLYRVK